MINVNLLIKCARGAFSNRHVTLLLEEVQDQSPFKGFLLFFSFFFLFFFISGSEAKIESQSRNFMIFHRNLSQTLPDSSESNLFCVYAET